MFSIDGLNNFMTIPEIVDTNEDIVKKAKKRKNTGVQLERINPATYTTEERLVAAVWVHERIGENNLSMAEIQAKFQSRFNKRPPTKHTLYFWEKKIFEHGNVLDTHRTKRPDKTLQKIPFVEASLKEYPFLSIRTRAKMLSMSRVTLKKILDDLKFEKPKFPNQDLQIGKRVKKSDMEEKSDSQAEESDHAQGEGSKSIQNAKCPKPLILTSSNLRPVKIIKCQPIEITKNQFYRSADMVPKKPKSEPTIENTATSTPCVLPKSLNEHSYSTNFKLLLDSTDPSDPIEKQPLKRDMKQTIIRNKFSNKTYSFFHSKQVRVPIPNVGYPYNLNILG